MAIVSMTFKKGETPPPLTPEQKAMLARLKDLPDSEIDTSDDWGEYEALTITSDKHLVQDFAKVCQKEKLSMNEVMNQLIQNYIQQHRIA